MQRYFAKRIKRTYLHSQSAQEVLQRLDTAYARFFKHLAKRPPKFKKSADFASFCYKQGGFSLCGNVFHVNTVKKDYKFSLSRPYEGKVKQVRVKRSHLNEWYIYVITDASPKSYAKTHDGASVGIDFGLKTYLSLSNGEKVSNPQFLKKDLRRLQKTSERHSHCVKDSNHKEQARLALCRLYESISDKRSDFQWKLAHDLCRQYDTIFIEDLNLNGMTRLWGRKMNDLAHGQFVSILEQVAAKYGCTVHKIDKWFPSSKLCDCGYKNDNLSLNDRTWVCPRCGQIHDRDVHAAEMILRRGIYELTSGSETNEATAEGHFAFTTVS
jgi:putative transposase